MKHSKALKLFVAAVMMCLLITAGSTALAGRADLEFSLESGFYEYPMPLEITCGVKSAKIYYTTDGSIPDETDNLYTGPLTLMYTTDKEDPLSHITGITYGENYVTQQDFPSAHVIRAVAILPEGTRSDVVGGTFFIGYNRQELYGDVPVVSLLIEPDFLFDYETGIYVLGKRYDEWAAEQTESYEGWQAQGNYSMRGRDWERPAYVEYLPIEGEGLQQDVGVRIKGAASRGNGQKSLRLIAREDYGEKNMKYAFFADNLREYDGKVLKKYKDITLRNGGNDWGFGKIRDPFIQTLATGLRMETAANQPVIAFINGEYWGLYTLHEEYSDNYVENHYDINNDNVITVKNGNIEDGEEEDHLLYAEMMAYINNNDMSDPAKYAKACTMLDMGSFADYVALTLYIGNEDGIFHLNNWQAWRVREVGEDNSPYADGKWRMMLFDTDFSSGIYDGGSNYGDDNLTDVFFGAEEGEWHTKTLLRSLYRNEDFKRELIMAMCDVRNIYFSKARVDATLDEMMDEYLPYTPDTFRRFGPDWVQWNPKNHSKSNMESIGTYFEGRYTRFHDIMRKALGLNAPATVTIKISGDGAVYLNGRDIPITRSLSGKYFTAYDLALEAVPAEGATFVGWEINAKSGAVADPAALETTLHFTRNCTLTAVFE